MVVVVVVVKVTTRTRLQYEDMGVFPAQHEYPVWYFFYGSLADHGILSRVLGVSGDCPVLKPASVAGGYHQVVRWQIQGSRRRPEDCVRRWMGVPSADERV